MIHRGGDLQSGNVKSCGCQKIALIKKGKRKHGHCSDGVMSTEYYSWAGMIARCTNPKNKAYKYYGGRGITVCERWLHSFQNFISDIGPKPESNWTIERVLVNGNYEPGNCKWATWEEQRLNKRKKAS
jgi:hypothetical protein